MKTGLCLLVIFFSFMLAGCPSQKSEPAGKDQKAKVSNKDSAEKDSEKAKKGLDPEVEQKLKSLGYVQ